ncbi:MAG: hypothetical protein Q9160_005574 [Pyrenula sp. 1 TL-2023]
MRTCPQGVPVWQAKAFGPIGRFSNGQPFTLAAWEASIANSSSSISDFNAIGGASEDCLFLDVYVPRDVLQKSHTDSKKREGASILVWIHGGGYVLGSKRGLPTPNSDPVGLLGYGQQEDSNAMIFVALNYRLGAPGFLAGPEVQKDGSLNAGLLDQRLALEWIQQNIHLFGGSADRVTVMGESAGGGSALLQTTAYGGSKGPAPFQQVIAQSPAIIPTYAQPPSTFHDFLSLLNVTTLIEARTLPSQSIISANARQIQFSPPNSYIYGPVLDNSFVPAPLSLSLQRHGPFSKSIKILSARNLFEGAFFFDPNVKTDADFRAWIPKSIPGLSDKAPEYLTTTLYPPLFDGSQGYTDQSSRQMALWGEAVIDCTAVLASNAFETSDSYAYDFAVPPALHTQDLSYTFNPPSSPIALYPKAQKAMQQAITSFTAGGVPLIKEDGGQSRPFPRWDGDERGRVVRITGEGAEIGERVVDGGRCEWWNGRGFED